jgi:hypothetical protein
MTFLEKLEKAIDETAFFTSANPIETAYVKSIEDSDEFIEKLEELVKKHGVEQIMKWYEQAKLAHLVIENKDGMLLQIEYMNSYYYLEHKAKGE